MHHILIKYCSKCGSSRRVVDLITREIKPLEENPEFQIEYHDIQGIIPEIYIDGHLLECDYKNYKALVYSLKKELEL
jgi:hypothetical protein